jgi:hypothetical protein
MRGYTIFFFFFLKKFKVFFLKKKLGVAGHPNLDWGWPRAKLKKKKNRFGPWGWPNHPRGPK